MNEKETTKMEKEDKIAKETMEQKVEKPKETIVEPSEKSQEDKKVTADNIDNKKEIKTPKKKQKEIPKKDYAIAYGKGLKISTKHAIAICNFIKGKTPEQAIIELSEVIRLKKAVPMKGEIPHRKGMMSGRYPVNASKAFINLLKSLIGNINVNRLDNPIIIITRADMASRPYKKGGSMKAKRSNVYLEAREKKEEKK